MSDLDAACFVGPGARLLTAAGGATIQGQARISVLPGAELMGVKLALDEGFFHPWHNHPENESMGVVIQGRLSMRIGDATTELGPGDTWHHPVGVFHETRALAPSLVVEFHSPLRPDLMALAAAEVQA